ncbi:MAG TPA: hypothetical protein DCY20_06555, partial [Firmicutes bacterium]|nr:hypothetical protein [Bacillota bacterium]
MIKYYKIHLLPTNEQKELMYKSFNAARFAYNWALKEQMTAIKIKGYPKHKFQLRKDFDMLKNLEAPFVLELSSKVTSQAVLDLCDDIEKNISNNKPLPRFKSVHLAKKSFFHRGDKLYFTKDQVKLEKIGWVSLGEHNRIPIISEYINPRITHEGNHFYLTVGCKLPDKKP